jgi:hypothetical protein
LHEQSTLNTSGLNHVEQLSSEQVEVLCSHRVSENQTKFSFHALPFSTEYLTDYPNKIGYGVLIWHPMKKFKGEE